MQGTDERNTQGTNEMNTQGTKERNTQGTNERNTQGTYKRMGGRPRAQKNNSQLVQAQKTLVLKDGVLTAAIWRCRLELAKKKGFRDIEASKDAVEVAGRDFMQASSIYCMYVEEDPAESFPDPAEEVRRALYERKVLTDMMEQVVEKAEEYLESATEENRLDELCEDEDGGNELNAKVNEVNEVSTVNDVNLNEVNEDNEENEVNVNVNEVKVEVFGMKEVKNLKDDNKVKVFDAKVNNGKVGLRLYDKKAEAKQSCPANWDPGELPDAKDQVEMLDVEEVANLMNNDKVARTGGVKSMMFFYALYNLTLYTSDALVALCMARFVNGFRRECPIELSDYG